MEAVPVTEFTRKLLLYTKEISKVVDFSPTVDKLLPLDFTSANTELSQQVVSDTVLFSRWINRKLEENEAKFAGGGYNEHRRIYSRSEHFDAGQEPRRLHLGYDIWGRERTAIYSPLNGIVHSFGNNSNFGDYGGTIILEHQLHDLHFYSLYGHLSLESIRHLREGQEIPAGSRFAEFGDITENGSWPPHLHFQLILDMKGFKGDFPGVCQFSRRDEFLAICPDPYPILKNTFE